MDIYINIILGIVSGIVTSFILWVLVGIFNKIISPWMKESLYQGVDIEGEWIGEYKIPIGSTNSNHTATGKYISKELTISINQSAYKITGDLVIKNINDTANIYSFYKITGTIKDNFITLNYSAKSKKSIGLGSLILVVRNGGTCLKGSMISTKLGTMELANYEGIELKRK